MYTFFTFIVPGVIFCRGKLKKKHVYFLTHPYFCSCFYVLCDTK